MTEYKIKFGIGKNSALILGILALVGFLYDYGVASGALTHLPTSGSIDAAAVSQILSGFPSLFLLTFFLGLAAGAFLTTYVFFEFKIKT